VDERYNKLKTLAEKELLADLDSLQKADVQGVMVDCWWGKVEAEGPGQYNWNGYKNLFSIVKAAKLELHVVMSFHACLENGVETIPLPGWVKSIGEAEDLFYKDAHGNPSTEYLSWAVDNERVFKDDQSGNQLSPLQVYENFMNGFNTHMVDYFDKQDQKGIITMIEVGLGPCGELRYPAYRLPWSFDPFPGVGEFQVSGIILCKSSATCNQALFQRNHMGQDSYAQEDLCSV
jgi:beta-amylase